MRVRVLFHDNCFDGAASTALFTAFYQSCIDPQAEFEYVGMNHGPGDVFVGNVFKSGDGIEHACLDFRYTPDPRLSWWFDHHQSAFLTPEDAAHFQRVSNPRHFYDPTERSCSKFLAQRCAAIYGFNPAPYEELIYWADLIDSARFDSPQMAVELKEPALQLMTWVEANRSQELKPRFIQDLRTRPLAEIVAQPYVGDALEPLLREHQQVLHIMSGRARSEGGVVTYDTTDMQIPAPNKFISYYLYPDCHYVVGVSAMPGRAKVSVGSNPWHAGRRTANIADICARYGGGGHPVVGAISLPRNQVSRAREVAQEIAAELRLAAEREQGS